MTLDGVSWVRGGVETVLAAHGLAVRQNRRHPSLPPSGHALDPKAQHLFLAIGVESKRDINGYEAAGHMLISAALEGHMCTSLTQLMRIALLLTAIDAALVLFPVTAHAGSGFRRAIDAGVAGARKVAVLVNIDKRKQKMTVSLDGVETYEWPIGWAEGD
jgi:hypothetical protein